MTTDIRRRLRAVGHTQDSFAAYVGVASRSVSRWATGKHEPPRWFWVVLELLERVLVSGSQG